MDPRASVDSQGSTVRNFSHGRGGAGNFGKERRESFTTPEDLATPTIKSDHYTTGRGGTGNIAKNDPRHPEIARASQDVDSPVFREHEGPHHYGRGGAANVAKPSEEEARIAKENNARKSAELDREYGSDEVKGWADKGKELLEKLGAKK
ncbi:hypothetical protein K432DRAFT_378887 [Lepidopterella palustris CBS 459.81]|uniref:Uncharacterized protein n=1 Tax=Lepidopterella palustris CBS 459.81 TaxID=1314670 RepID=A0A8E2JJA9_9PEZI|nr:hypothetical protein K432DRAFT_378887 [Lepidopterella palustris CBS 459.81]